MQANETELLQQLSQLKARINQVLGTRARIELNITDVPTENLRLLTAPNTTITNNGHCVTIQSVAGRINITDDSMPF